MFSEKFLSKVKPAPVRKQRMLAMAVAMFAASLTSSFVTKSGLTRNPEPQTRSKGQRHQRSKVQPKPKINYANFSHQTHVVGQKLACDSCHKFPSSNWKEVRKGDAAYADVTDFPEHASCLNCHRQQFFTRERP